MKITTEVSCSFSHSSWPRPLPRRWLSLQSASSRFPPQRLQQQSSVNLIGRTEPPCCTLPSEMGGSQRIVQSAVGAGVSLTVKLIDFEPLPPSLVALATKV